MMLLQSVPRREFQTHDDDDYIHKTEKHKTLTIKDKQQEEDYAVLHET